MRHDNQVAFTGESHLSLEQILPSPVEVRVAILYTLFSLLIVTPVLAASAAPIIPIEPGMSWVYNLTQEAGEGVAFSDSKTDEEGNVHAVVTYRLDGTVKVDGKDLLKFEMHRAGVLTNTDLMTVDEHGINCFARIELNRVMVKLVPAQPIIAAPLKAGASWDFDGKLGELAVHQHFGVIGEEDVVVPAGKFHAFHIHGEQTRPTTMIVDRWVVDGVGIVKDVTAMRSGSDELLRRISLELKERPKVAARPEVKPAAPAKKLTATVGRDPIGGVSDTFAADTKKIYAHWQGHQLPKEAKIRATWIAENVEDIAPPDYTIDEADATAPAPNSHGNFVLSRPEEGWAPGEYRVEFYVDGALVDTVKLKIAK